MQRVTAPVSSTGFRTPLQVNSVPGLHLMGIRYHPSRRPLIQHPGRAAAEVDPLLPVRRERFNRHPEGTLAWFVVSNRLNFKAAVRNWAKRRTKQAFADALSARGYDELGQNPKPGSPCLKGDLELLPYASSFTAKHLELRREVDLVLDWLEAQHAGKKRRTGKYPSTKAGS